MAAMGLGDGTHSLGGMSVDIKGDCATLLGTDTLAGSVVSIDTCVKRFKQFTGCTAGQALLCATLHPAMVLKRHVVKIKVSGVGVSEAPIGVLEVGAAADLVLLSDDLDVLGTVVGGVVASEIIIKA
jgi:N-acetylglucosamine-6-phosphate deacetylase